MKPSLVSRGDFLVVGLRGLFTPKTIPQIPMLWGRFAPVMHTVPRRVDPVVCYGLCVADVKDERGEPCLEYTACVEVASLGDVPAGMVGRTVPGAKYAVFTHTGHIREIGKTWDAIHQRWLRDAGLAKSATHDFERYDARWNPQTGEGPVEIWVPVGAPA